MNWDKNDFLKESRRRAKVKVKEDYSKTDLFLFSQFKNFINNFVCGIDVMLKLEESNYEIIQNHLSNGFTIRRKRDNSRYYYKTISLFMNKQDKRVNIRTDFKNSDGTKLKIQHLNRVTKINNFFNGSDSTSTNYRLKDFDFIMKSSEFAEFIFALIADAELNKEVYFSYSAYGYYIPQSYRIKMRPSLSEHKIEYKYLFDELENE